jgi:NhaC family Na+:H+ antiporter
VTLLTAFFTAAFGCTQTLAIMLTHHLMGDIYRKNGINNSALALDIEDSTVLVSALIPWNIALAMPMVILSVGVNCVPYAVYLYIFPLYRIFFSFPKERRVTLESK